MPWDKSLESAFGEIEKGYKEDSRKLAFYGFSRCIQVSPVDTGQFVRSWEINQTKKGWKITNPMPYAQRLDDGHSKQAPDGIIDIVISDMESFRDV